MLGRRGGFGGDFWGRWNGCVWQGAEGREGQVEMEGQKCKTGWELKVKDNVWADDMTQGTYIPIHSLN